jgi:hypothetical protein
MKYQYGVSLLAVSFKKNTCQIMYILYIIWQAFSVSFPKAPGIPGTIICQHPNDDMSPT